MGFQRGGLSIIVTAALAALLACFIAWVQMLQVQTQSSLHWPWWRAAAFVAHSFTTKRWVELLIWSAASGLLIATGMLSAAGRSRGTVRRPGRRTVLGAAAAGVFIALSTLMLAATLSRRWPYAESLRDAPVMALVLGAYGLSAPWVCGRLLRD